MSAPVWCEFVCDVCNANASGMWSAGGRVPFQSMAASAKSEGFKINGDSVLCGRCTHKPAASTDPLDGQQRGLSNHADFLSPSDLADLVRLDGLLEDGEGWDLPVETMHRLAAIGVVRHHSRGVYSITSFGYWVLGSAVLRLPLETVDECNARLSVEHKQRLGLPGNLQAAVQAVKTPVPYDAPRIAWELDQTASGAAHYGNALLVAKDMSGVNEGDRALLDRYATGSQAGTDHVALYDLAIRIRQNAQGGER